jgi:hypothetical protein
MGIQFNGQDFEPAEIQKMLDAGLSIGEKHDVNAASPGAMVPHGIMFNQNVAGLFTRPGAEPGMFSTITQPDGAWLAGMMTEPSVILNPEYDILTGVRDCVGNNADDACGDAPRPGALKLCTTSNRFGEMFMRTDQVQLNKIGGRINRADMDKTVINNPMVYPIMPDVVRAAQNINTQWGFQATTLGITVHRWLTRAVFHGVYGSTGANAYCGFVREFDGFDRLIRTGYLDIDSGNHCTAADSKVITWGNTDACDKYQGHTMVDLISWLMNYFSQKADDQNMVPTQWIIAMRPGLFNALVQCWPCDYNTYGCNLRDDNSERTASASELIAMRDAMKQGSYLLVNGGRVPIWQTSAIEETVYGAGFRSTIYIIPTNSLGIRTTYLEWFDQNNADIRQYISAAGGTVHYGTMNNGLWAVTENQTGMCHEYYFASQPRLVMRTPWLAARITNVVYNAPFNLYPDSPYPAETYHKDGGHYTGSLPYYGGDWVGTGSTGR